MESFYISSTFLYGFKQFPSNFAVSFFCFNSGNQYVFSAQVKAVIHLSIFEQSAVAVFLNVGDDSFY